MNVGLNQAQTSPSEISKILLSAHPVGSIYMSDNATSPAALFGGSWEQIKDRFILAAGSTYAAGKTGGAKNHEHTLEGTGFAKLAYAGDGYPLKIFNEASMPAWNTNWRFGSLAIGWEAKTETSTGRAMGLGGKTNAVDNMPPYYTAYIWRRVA